MSANPGQVIQDMPPKGGFPKITYARAIPTRGPPGWVWLTAGVLATVLGTGALLRGRRVEKVYKAEKRRTRLAVLPFLQAETDLMLLAADRERRLDEAFIMREVPGWNVDDETGVTRHVPKAPRPTNY
eukprot:TRINITY_DN1226_c0_g1_i3.p1 TRINITY_DN1226_c0_g1~~TRINITY_DN1226_c0_g1_i3.p1  ORF type:complete len:142 (-),score=39.66 TRINITY_DN1226_c0_g1_i3:19-402(-)